MKNDVLIDDQKKKSLTVTNLIWMGFTVVWGFGNVVNNYANQGLAVITSWIFIMALYFIPYEKSIGFGFENNRKLFKIKYQVASSKSRSYFFIEKCFK